MTRSWTVPWRGWLAVALLVPCLALGAPPAPPPDLATSPEARLIAVYRLVRAGDARTALAQAEALARDVPNFQLAQLVYADLLLVRQGAFAGLGEQPASLPTQAREPLAQLRLEAGRRLAALTERPPADALPREFVELPASTRHAVAVDASRSRLYLFERGRDGFRLVRDHYVSVGRLGVGKVAQGDQRTPLGVYFITSRLDPGQLQDFYGAGALPLNYPNEYDRRQGRTGHGIWLHGVPRQNFARTPLSTDGCVVLANEDMQRLLRELAPRSTPVLISPAIQWVTPAQGEAARLEARRLLEQWRLARSSGDPLRLVPFYAAQFSNGMGEGQPGLLDWLGQEMRAAQGRAAELKDVSILSWRDKGQVLVITFGLVNKGQRTGQVKRQYWAQEGGQWKIFFEGVIG